LRLTSAEKIVDQLDGATIVSVYVEDDTGMHICFQDGRTLIIAGAFALSLMRIETTRLH
jgi:hypothetical protein